MSTALRRLFVQRRHGCCDELVRSASLLHDQNTVYLTTLYSFLGTGRAESDRDDGALQWRMSVDSTSLCTIGSRCATDPCRSPAPKAALWMHEYIRIKRRPRNILQANIDLHLGRSRMSRCLLPHATARARTRIAAA